MHIRPKKKGFHLQAKLFTQKNLIEQSYEVEN